MALPAVPFDVEVIAPYEGQSATELSVQVGEQLQVSARLTWTEFRNFLFMYNMFLILKEKAFLFTGAIIFVMRKVG